LARTQSGYFSLWPACYLAFMFFYNFSDSTIIAHNDLFWILFVGIGLPISQTDARPYRAAQTRVLCHNPTGAQILAQTSTPSNSGMT
jgi:O-antigen ligase